MSEWKSFVLKELTTKIGSGATPRGGQEAYKTEGISLIRSQNVLDFSFSYSGLAFIDEKQADGLKNVIIEPNDVLINITGDSVARVAKVPNQVLPSRVNQHVAILRANKEILDSDYLLYYLLNPIFKRHLLRIASDGATRDSLTKSDLEELVIIAPEDINKQKDVAKLLSIYDQKITLLRQQNQDLEELAQTLFKRWFVEFEFPNENGEPYKSSGGKMIESELGEIPEGWRAVQLQDIVEIGSSKRIFASEYLQEGIPFYRGKEITELSNGKNLVPEIFISNERFINLKESSGAPKENDILLTSVGTIGNTYLVEKEENFYFKDGNLTWFKGYKTYIDSTFIYIWLNSKYAEIAIEGIKIGSTQQAITIASLNAIEIIIPSEEIYFKLKDSLKSTISKRQTNSNEIQTLTQLRDTLLPKLMSGEIRLNHD